MIGSNAFNYVNVLNKAADASWIRNEVIANNIANVSTPGYKRKDIKFEGYLKNEIMKDGLTGGDLNKRVANVDLDRLGTRIYTDQAELSYRKDGNNVGEGRPAREGRRQPHLHRHGLLQRRGIQ